MRVTIPAPEAIVTIQTMKPRQEGASRQERAMKTTGRTVGWALVALLAGCDSSPVRPAAHEQEVVSPLYAVVEGRRLKDATSWP